MKAATALSVDERKQLEAHAWKSLTTKFEPLGRQLARRHSSEQTNLTTALLQGKLTEAQMKGALTKLRETKMQVAPKLPNWPAPRDLPVVQLSAFKIYSPPYDYAGTTEWHFGNPDQWVQVAQNQPGLLNLSEGVSNNSGGGWAVAGVGSWFVPQTPNPFLVYFRPLFHSAYWPCIESAGLGAATHGEIGVQVVSFAGGDASTKNVEGDNSQVVFDKRTNFYDSDCPGDWNYSVSSLELAVPINPTRQYICIAYIFANSDASGLQGGFLGLAGSQASTQFASTVRYIQMEEQGSKEPWKQPPVTDLGGVRP